MDALDVVYLATLALVALVAFHDAPRSLLRARREDAVTRDAAYHVANAASVVVLVGWLVVVWVGPDRAVAPVDGAAYARVRWGGLAIAATGAAVSVWARLALAGAFVPTSAVRKGQGVVRRGPYAHVRHPFYLGLLVALAGGVLVLDSVATLVALLLVAPLVVVIARKEEEHLVRVLGEAYEAYADEVGRWWPRRLTRRAGRR